MHRQRPQGRGRATHRPFRYRGATPPASLGKGPRGAPTPASETQAKASFRRHSRARSPLAAIPRWQVSSCVCQVLQEGVMVLGLGCGIAVWCGNVCVPARRIGLCWGATRAPRQVAIRMGSRAFGSALRRCIPPPSGGPKRDKPKRPNATPPSSATTPQGVTFSQNC